MKHQRDTDHGAQEDRVQPSPENHGAAAAPDDGRGSFLRRVWIAGAAGAVIVAVMGLLGYVPGLGVLGSVRPDYIPMAPSTAISFIVLGGILLVLTRRSLSGASLIFLGALAALVSLFGLLEVAGYFAGMELNFEDVLVPSAGHLGEIPIGRMSPATGAAFLLAGLAVLALVLRQSRPPGRGMLLGHGASGLGGLTLGVSLLFCLAYLQGSPLLYGNGTTIPMALTTALAFLMLGAATVGASRKEAAPSRLLAGAKRMREHMSARKRLLLLTLVMVVACATVMMVMTVVLYRNAIQEHQELLQVTAQSRARSIEAIARFDIKMAAKLAKTIPDYNASASTLSQVVDAHERFKGFGKTGEFTLARRKGNSIAFLLRHRHDIVEQPAPVAFDSDLAEPMRLALEGKSGTIIGLDYRGETVVAAYEPVDILNFGIVAKIDLAEVRTPFIRAGLVAVAVAFLVILGGMALFVWIGNPMISQLEAQAKELKSEVFQRRESERKLQSFMASATEGFAVYDSDLELVSINKTALKIFPAGSTEENLRGKHILEIAPSLKETGRYVKYAEVIQTGRALHFDDIIPDAQFGERHLSLHAFKVGTGLGMIFSDITEGKRAEDELKKAHANLEQRVEERTTELKARTEEAEKLNRAMVNLLEDLRELNQGLETAKRELRTTNNELESFSYSVSHDLRAPLRHVDGFVKLLLKHEKDRLDSTSSDYLEKIAGASGRMGQLIDDLLAFSRTGRSEMHLQRVDPNEVVQDAVKELSPVAEGRRIVWKLGDLPWVQADSGLLQRVWENLIGNAIKYTGLREEACIEIGATHEGCEEGTDEIAFFIRDNGAGFDPQYTNKLFGVFQRLHRDDEFEGTGIGLATVRRIVHRHGGRVWAEGEVDKGATFYFTMKKHSGEKS
jgi:PAS domain S-box-containing protein